MFVPIPDQPGLIHDYESDTFVGHTLSSATCELYHRYSTLLTPLTATLITLKHARFGHCCPVRVHDGGDEAGDIHTRGGASTVRWKELRTQSRKLRIQKKWQPGVPALPPERRSSSSSFGRPRNHFVPLPAAARLPIFIQRKRTRNKRFPVINGGKIAMRD